MHTNQARIVAWDNIKDNPPRELEISPIAAIPHKSKAFCSILDLSFWLKLKNGGGCWHQSMTQWKILHQKGQLTRLGIACHKYYMRLRRGTTQQKYLWQSGTSRMASGISADWCDPRFTASHISSFVHEYPIQVGQPKATHS